MFASNPKWGGLYVIDHCPTASWSPRPSDIEPCKSAGGGPGLRGLRGALPGALVVGSNKALTSLAGLEGITAINGNTKMPDIFETKASPIVRPLSNTLSGVKR